MAAQRRGDTGDSSVILVLIDKFQKRRLPRALRTKNLLDFEKHVKKQDWEEKLLQTIEPVRNRFYRVEHNSVDLGLS